MPITMMVDKSRANEPGIVAQVYDGNTIYLETTHQGLVIEVYERNGYNDSDFYAKVWNPETKSISEIQYATTRGWTYPNSAVVDATPEVLAEVKQYLEKAHIAREANLRDIEASNPTVGKRVAVVSGQKHKSKTGRIFWRGANQFRTYYKNGYNRPESMNNQRVGIETNSGEKFFVAATQVRVIDSKYTPVEAQAHVTVMAVAAAHGISL